MVGVSEDIIFGQIITRLPVKTIVRLRCVSKLWNRFLSDPDPEFISSHISHTSQNPEYESLLINTYKDHHTALNSSIDILTRSRLSYTRIENPPRHRKYIVGCINGLVCLTCKDMFVLWNPATGLSKTIVPPQHFAKCWQRFYGLGWNYADNDFKLVCCYTDGKSALPCVVYSSNSDSWTPLLIPDSLDLVCSQHTPYTIVKGCPYWNKVGSTFKFETKTNQFNKFLLPDRIAMAGNPRFLLANSKETLVGMSYSWVANWMVDVHQLDEECGVWSKKYTIGPINCYVGNLCQCFKYSGEIVFDNAKKLYDPKTNGIKVIGDGSCHFISGFSYTPSLVVLQGMEPMHGKRHQRPGEFERWEFGRRLGLTHPRSRSKLLIRIARIFLGCFLCWNNN